MAAPAPAIEDRLARLERLLETTARLVAVHTVQTTAQRQVLGKLLSRVPEAEAQALMQALNAGADQVEELFGLQSMADYRAELDAILTEAISFRAA